MAHNLAETSLELTKVAGSVAAQESGRVARQIGNTMIGPLRRLQPGYVPPEVAAQQAVLKEFEGRFVILSDFMNPDKSDEDLELAARVAADAMVEEGAVEEHSIVELRSVLPEATVGDKDLYDRRERAMELLGHAFEDEYNVLTVPNRHTITPSVHLRSPIDAGDAWESLAPELDGLSHHLRDGGHKPAMAGITGFGYERTLFGSGPVTIAGTPHGSNVLALERVGRQPEDNVLRWMGSRVAEAA